eukprot:COSAG05_NODE_1648_length_4340_cov_79.370667_2_plen_42_part_00
MGHPGWIYGRGDTHLAAMEVQDSGIASIGASYEHMYGVGAA